MKLSLWAMVSAVAKLTEKVIAMSEALERLTNEVREMRTVTESATTALSGIAELIRENAADEDAMNSLADDLDNQAADLSAAVEENSVEPAPAPAPADVGGGEPIDNTGGGEPSPTPVPAEDTGGVVDDTGQPAE